MLSDRIKKFEKRGNYLLKKGFEVIGEEEEARNRLTLAYGYAVLLEDIKRRRICHSLLGYLGYEEERIDKIRRRGVKAVGMAWRIVGTVKDYC